MNISARDSDSIEIFDKHELKNNADANVNDKCLNNSSPSTGKVENEKNKRKKQK